MARSEVYRALVESRAGGACEYCRLLQLATGVTFHIEHFLPRCLGGETALRNLVMSCPGCNLAKADRVEAPDESGVMTPLFNPREYEPWLLGWHLHFMLDTVTGIIVPRSEIGEATVQCLRMNDSLRVFARKLQCDLGLIG
jgi:hypothetical protein